MLVDMEYDTDTLTAACKNRAASKKLFQQLQQQALARTYHSTSPFEQTGMLHRTPSGAQKKIRQRQEQKWLKATSSATVDQQGSNSDCGGYRSFVDSNAYKSILPDDVSFLMPPAPPRAPPRFSAPLTSLNSTVSSSVSPCSTATTSTIGGKPTVEVHPMPSKQQTDSACMDLRKSPDFTHSKQQTNSACMDLRKSPDFVVEKARVKPVVPKKPPKLLLSRNESPVAKTAPLSVSMNSLNFTPTSSQQTFFTPLQPISTSSSPPYNSASQPSPSTSRLFSTPSLMCLHTALMQPSLSKEEVDRLEAKRQKLISSISRKVDVLDKERTVLLEEFEANDALRRMICDELIDIGAQALVDKIERNFIQNAQLITLETRLRLQLERFETMCVTNEGNDKDIVNARLLRLREQVDDHAVLRKSFDRRDVEVDKQVQLILSEQRLSQWRFYKEIWRKLTAERQEIEERLNLGREQLAALQKAQPAV